jgi:hypothetical protein
MESYSKFKRNGRFQNLMCKHYHDLYIILMSERHSQAIQLRKIFIFLMI